jgi:SAM-dependent methyltransferase
MEDTPEQTVSRMIRDLGSKTDMPGGKEAYGKWPTEAKQELNPYEKLFIDRLCQANSNEKVLSILDAGCGNGLTLLPFLYELKQKGYDISVFMRDIQQDAIEHVNANYNQLSSQLVSLDARTADLTALDLPDNSIDGLISSSVLGWLPDSESIHRTLSHFHRVLTPDGLIYLSVMTPFNRVGIYNDQTIQEGDMTRRDEVYALTHPNGEESSEIWTVQNSKYQKPVHLFTQKALTDYVEQASMKVEFSTYKRNDSIKFRNGFTDEYPEILAAIVSKI